MGREEEDSNQLGEGGSVSTVSSQQASVCPAKPLSRVTRAGSERDSVYHLGAGHFQSTSAESEPLSAEVPDLLHFSKAGGNALLVAEATSLTGRGCHGGSQIKAASLRALVGTGRTPLV